MRHLVERSPPPRPSRLVGMWLCSSEGKERLETEVWKSVAHRCPYGAWGTSELPEGRTKRQGLSPGTKGRVPRLNHWATRAGKATKADWLERLPRRQDDNQDNVASRSQHGLAEGAKRRLSDLQKRSILWEKARLPAQWTLHEKQNLCRPKFSLPPASSPETVGERPVFHHLAPRSALQSWDKIEDQVPSPKL